MTRAAPEVRRSFGRIALSPKEAAESLGVSCSWLREQMKMGGLPYSRVNGRVFIRPEKLCEWLEAHEERRESEVERIMALADADARE